MGQRDNKNNRPSARTKHGYFTPLETEYDAISLDEVYAELDAEFKPSTFTARLLVRQLTMDTARLTRLQKFEAEVLREELNPPKYFDPLEIMLSADRPLVHEGEKARISEAFLKKVDPIYSRHENTVFNRIIRILEIIKASKS